MRDLTQDIINSLQVLLNNLYSTENKTKFPVLDTLPETQSFNLVWIKGIRATQNGTKDKNVQVVTIDLEVISGGMAQKGSLKAINDISDQILQVIENISLNDFLVVIKPEMVSYNFLEQREQRDNQTIIIDRKQLSFEMLIQELWK